jgi:hypothetical protein
VFESRDEEQQPVVVIVRDTGSRPLAYSARSAIPGSTPAARRAGT